jgi:hypothetical protein
VSTHLDPTCLSVPKVPAPPRSNRHCG